MHTVSIGAIAYRLVAEERDGQWTAHARRIDTGDRFGTEVTGPSEAEATTRLVRWLEWQREHAAALDDLQEAERLYHRTIANGAFTMSPDVVRFKDESLARVEAARVTLDAVRGRQPRP